jgi:pyrroloquinoline-quinone synthase
MSFANGILTENMEPLRQRLLYHPLWTGIDHGTIEYDTLRAFALQNWWLLREAYRLDALGVVGKLDLEMQDLLLAKLVPKISAYQLLQGFGEALGLSQADFYARGGNTSVQMINCKEVLEQTERARKADEQKEEIQPGR